MMVFKVLKLCLKRSVHTFEEYHNSDTYMSALLYLDEMEILYICKVQTASQSNMIGIFQVLKISV
jgi:hypothetical protein